MKRPVAAVTLFVVTVATSCDGTKPMANGPRAEPDARSTRFCDGVPGLSNGGVAHESPFVTYQDDAGQGCVFTLGPTMADIGTCGNVGPSARQELDCPSTSLSFHVWGSMFFSPQLYVQAGYAFTSLSGRLRHGRVLEMVIDSTTGSIVTGHFALELDAMDSAPVERARGTFRLCMTPGSSVEPYRNM